MGLALLVVVTGCLSSLTGDDRSAPDVQSHHAYNETITGQGGIAIVTTIFQPAGASSQAPVPMVLHSHGWAGNRTWAPTGFIGQLLDAGYGVVSIDMRGHGASAGQARVHSMDHEIVDVQRVIDHVASLPWVEQEAPGDPVLGAIGGSYGGAYQLLTAAVDDRLDALAPEITWNDLPQALVPNRAVKSAWIHALYGAGKANARLHEDIDEAWSQALITNQVPEPILAQFDRSSPASYPRAIDVPTLLIQGVPDTLFNLNHAVANLQQIQATGADARLVTHLDGHLLNPGVLADNESLQRVPAPQPGEGGSPCGDIDQMRLAWFDEHLRGHDGAADTIANVSMAMLPASGPLPTCRTFEAWPPVPSPTPAAVTEPVVLPQAAAGGSDERTLVDGLDQPTGLAGIPTATLTVTTTGPATIYLSLLRAADTTAGETHDWEVLDSQVTPLRIESATDAEELSVDLGGVAAELGDDHAIGLRVATWNEQYGTNAERTPGAVTVSEIGVQLPLLSPTST